MCVTKPKIKKDFRVLKFTEKLFLVLPLKFSEYIETKVPSTSQL